VDKRLLTLLSAGGLNGSVALAAAAGLFRPENALVIAFSFMSGPGAVLAATLLEGGTAQRILAAGAAGAIATVVVAFAAAAGPRLATFLNLDVLKIVGGASVIAIGLILMGLKLPDRLPVLMMLSGLVAAVILR
jgi:hypothetical protein